MQDYTPLGSTATTTVKEGILNHEKNINALRSTYSGTAFPTENLVAGLKCYRTDLGKTYTYNGEVWDDSVNTSSLTVSGETSVPTPSTENNSKTIANTEFVHGVVNNLVNGAPTALDTLQELATALGNDPNFSTTVLNQIGEKEGKTDAQIEHEKLQNAIDLCLKGKKSMGITPETNPQIIAIPLERGIFPIQGYPDGFTVADKKYAYSVVVNFQGESGALLSFYAQHTKRELYFRVGWSDKRGWGLWTKLATTDEIPTKVSQLSNDSGYQKTAEIPVVSQTQNGYMSKSDKAKLDGIAEGATNVTDYVQSVTESNGKVTVTKGGGDSTIINLVDTFYPVGTVYMSADKSKTKADFPFMKHGTWEEVPANLCLQTGDTNEAGTQRSAGLPNITGVLGVVACNGTHRSGAFVSLKTSEYIADKLEWQSYRNDVGIDASLSNTLYGASDTVQPPAYMIRAWVRTA